MHTHFAGQQPRHRTNDIFVMTEMTMTEKTTKLSSTKQTEASTRQSRDLYGKTKTERCYTKTKTSEWLFFVVMLLCALARECVGQNQQQMQQMQQQQMQQQQIQMRLQKAFEENPRDSKARFELAFFVALGQGLSGDLELLKSCFDGNQVDYTLQETNIMMAYIGAHVLGRYEAEINDSKEARKYLKIAYESSRAINSPQEGIGEVCTHLQLATLLDVYPLSNQDVDDSIANMEEWAHKLIDLMAVQKHKDAVLRVDWLGESMPGFKTDPYIHCVLSPFSLSFYYRADVAKIANLYYQLAVLAFPRLLYTAQHVKEFEALQEEQRKQLSPTSEPPTELPPPLIQSCVDRKIKLGVIGSTLGEFHSVTEDFGGILQRLDRDVFEISYHFLHEKSSPTDAAAFMTANPSDKLYHYHKPPGDMNDGAWVRRFGQDIEKFRLDMVLYLDLTMSTFTRRLGMERLAPVQINSHGHPVTSGIPRETIQHFVSWAEAELPIEQSQTHYTEELQLIPKGKIHQYYTPRLEIDKKGTRISRITKMPFDHLTRKDFEELPKELRNSSPQDENIHIYTCMQKPFKVFPEFDELLCGILTEDPDGHAILHKETATGHTDAFLKRLQVAGCDMKRVHFVSPQSAHRLMALYKISTVILDSYPAGGCTTTREVLELGKAIVTWPARLLGGRWTLGLYKTIGLDEASQQKVIANSKEEYIAKAVALGTDQELRKGVEQKILEAVPNLFGRQEAVEEWEKILLKVSPVKHCKEADGQDQKNILAKDEL